MEENFSLGGLRKKIDLSQLKGGLKAEQFDFGKKNKLESVFKKIDADGDGTITADEMSNYIDLLQDAAGADKKLNRKEAKAAGLGNRRHINKFLKQAIELSQNIKTPQEPSVEPEVTTPDVPVEDTPIEDTVVEEPPISIDGDEGDDASVEQDEFTAADALIKLFGGKRKASVKIDGSATGLGRAYQGEIRLPNGETIEDGAFPENLRMTLPPEYGSNATMKLKLIDPENGIYETSAKDRNFQIVTDENGNVTVQSVNVDELQGKLNANLAEYARIEAERQAAEEAAQAGGADGAEGADEGVQQLSKEQIEAAKEHNRKAGVVADELHNALKGARWDAVSGKAFQTSLKKVTSENASAVLSQYNTKHPDESLVRMICNEKTSDDETRCEALKYIMKQLGNEAIAKGVSTDEVEALVTEFNTSADDEFGSVGVIDATVMDNTMKRLLGLTQGATLNADDISVAEAQESVTTGAQNEYNTAKQSYDTAREEEGWFAKRGDDFLGWFGYTTRADMEEKLGKYKGDIEKLQNCQTEEEFQTAYKEVFGIPYDGKKVAAYQAAYSDYVVAYGAKENADKMQTLFDEARGLNYDAYKTKVMSAMNMSADEVDALVDGMSEEYMAQHPNSNKKDVLRNWVDQQKQQSIQQFDQIAKGRSLEQINQDIDSVRQAAFGTNDIVNDVIKYNSNQQITGMATEIAAEIAVTTALAVVPGGQAFAAARVAASAAKWGSRGVKLARYMPKAANLASKASSAVRNSKVVRTATNATTRAANAVKDSKLARNVSNAAGKIKDATPAGVRTSAGRIARSSDAAFEGTLAVNLVDGKSVEDSLKKALQNAAFAGAGATSAELAPFVAKALGCSSKVATEICEQSLDLASTAGISYGVSGGYTSDDALIDVITGVAMNRIGKIKGRQGNTEKVKPQQELPVPDEHHIRLSEAPRDVLDAQEADITFAGAQARNQSTLQRATNNNTSTTGGSFSEQKFEQVKDEVRQELSQPTTAKRAAEIHDEADKHQIQDRDQGREIKHIVEDATGVYDSPTLGKIDLAKETDPAKLAQAKKEISQWFDGKKDVRGDAARDRQELLDKIDARMAELNADPNLQGQKVESKIVEELNANTEKNAAQVLANQGKPLSPHGASILDDQIKLTNTVEDLETMKKQLESRVGYQVQGTDHAAATIKKIDAKIKSVKAHQADFAATTGRIDDAISAGKGLNADDLQTIRAFMEKSNSADELKQIADKMNSSKAIRSYGGSKKLIKDINAKIETLNAKALTSDGVSTGAAANTQQANYVDANQSKMQDAPEAELGDTRTNAPEQSAIETETPVVDPHHIQVDGSPRPVEVEGATIDFETARRNMPPEQKVTEPEVEIIRMEAPDPGVDPHKVTVDGSPRPAEVEGATIDFETARANMPKTKQDVNAELLQDKLFMHTEKLASDKVTKFLTKENIDYQGGLIRGNGTVAFEQNGVNYQLSYEDGKLSALRVHDYSTGNKTYYSYDAVGNKNQIARDEFIEKFESSNKKYDSTLAQLEARQNSKYPLDNNGFVRVESYKDMSPDELVAEYKRLSEYEAGGTRSWSEPSPSGKIFLINSHDMSVNKAAIREALEERGLKLTRDYNDNQSIPEYGYKNVEKQEFKLSPEQELRVRTDFEEPANLSDEELLAGVNRLNNRRRYYDKQGNELETNHTARLRELNAELGKRGLKVENGALTKITEPEVEVVVAEPVRKSLSSADKITMSEIGNKIPNAKTSADLDKLQQQIDKLPDSPQKTQLQKQLDKKKAELNEVAAWVDVDQQGRQVSRSNNDQNIIDLNNQAAADAFMADQFNYDNPYDDLFDMPDNNMF